MTSFPVNLQSTKKRVTLQRFSYEIQEMLDNLIFYSEAAAGVVL